MEAQLGTGASRWSTLSDEQRQRVSRWAKTWGRGGASGGLGSPEKTSLRTVRHEIIIDTLPEPPRTPRAPLAGGVHTELRVAPYRGEARPSDPEQALEVIRESPGWRDQTARPR